MKGDQYKEIPVDEHDKNNQTFSLIVIGASAGGFNVLKEIISRLPDDLNAAVLIVWHMAPTLKSILPDILGRYSNMITAHAQDNEPLRPNRIYIAPPDRHMVVEDGRIRVTRGPKENRFRPAIDPLFRSGAFSYGNRVIGVILSGALDDGTAGLWQIKQFGGTTIVQDPKEAEYSSMPESALRHVEVDYCLPVARIGELLTELASRTPFKNADIIMDDKTAAEIEIALGKNAFEKDIMKYGELTPYACPECHGVLNKFAEGSIERYRCHTGHAYSADSLLDAITEKIEDSLYSAIRGVDESVILLNHMGDHFAEKNQTQIAARFFQKAKDANERSKLIRRAVLQHEQLSQQSIDVPPGDSEVRENNH